MMKKILVATDFSPASKAALDCASALASEWRALLLIVHVEEPLIMTGSEAYYAQTYTPTTEMRQTLESIIPTRADIRHEHCLLFGFAADELLRLADDEHVDLIVMGTHGRTGLSRMLMGSVAETIVRKAKCPVLTIKQPEGGSATGEPSVAVAAK